MKANNRGKYMFGSEWRIWDLHVHTPETQKNDLYKVNEDEDPWDLFCKKINNSDVEGFGICDYFSVKNYFKFIEKYFSYYPKSNKMFFPNIELCTNDVVNKAGEEVNLHLIFNPKIPDLRKKLDEFLRNLETNQTDSKGRNYKASDLSKTSDFEKATTTRKFIEEAYNATFGKKSQMIENLLIITAANNDGLRAIRGVKRKECISDELDKFSNCFFGNKSNTDYFMNENRLEDGEKTISKPVITGSDSHSFEDLDNYLGKEFRNTDGVLVKQITWIKSDLTFEGLKQILFEPLPGERVWIGAAIPDSKDDFKVIKEIRFKNSKCFPEQIEFNQNLNSIIGSRSAGKSALLAYLAYFIDPQITARRKEDGPGDGEDFNWKSLKEECEVLWANGEKMILLKGELFIFRKIIYIK